ncbi:hypothetical protein B0H15DRAFT_810959 [Mycena belliarum]|uniref:Uncharacterized protein n=1 Tax=Mycena belliarum TaxID=1033014 RepID=A0AAD6UNU0_9AGAR|nr:hypothetical protein B0H15DRAFT_810959 [Mycena belliae]
MLARLSAAASQIELSDMSRNSDEPFFLDMDTFRLVLPVPDISWGRVAQICERAVNPMYTGLYSILEQDMEHVAQVLAALESDSEPTENHLVPCNVPADSSSESSRADSTPELLIIPSSHPSIPTIVITPCPRQPREASYHVPYQDSAFRNQLTVPCLPSFNQSFPPMTPPPRRVSMRGIKHWMWKNGHWQAALRASDQPRPRILKHRRNGRATSVKYS